MTFKKRPVRYNEEKVLYFAARPQTLHVHPSEQVRGTTLWHLVSELVKQGCIEHIGEDDSGAYYKATPKGRVRLTKLQAQWQAAQARIEQ